ncbi:ATP-binding protein [Halomonas sp. SpR1]|nr:ATP-binding protein [Halomonas sp. SpR1]
MSRRYRNRRIGEFLKELDLTEGRSTGVPKILRVMKANGSPLPVFETDDERSYFLIRLPVHEGFLVGKEAVDDVTPGILRLLESFEGEAGRADLMAALRLQAEKHFREHYQQIAIKQGLIEMTISDKPRSRLQKYQLTDLGKRVLATKNTHQ